MNSPEENPVSMSSTELYREEVFTDRKVGAIKLMTPVTASGEDDSSREKLFIGETQIMLGNNPLPISFEIPADTIGEAAGKFSEIAQEEAQQTVKRLQEMQRDMQSSIVVPGQDGGMGGMGGGGKIQIP